MTKGILQIACPEMQGTTREASRKEGLAERQQEKGTQSDNRKKLNPANTLTEQGNRFFTRVSSKERSPTSTLIFVGCQISNLANYEIINGYCFKALILWLFATAAIAN